MKLYKIADFIFGVHMDESLDIPENFKKFEISSSPEDIQTDILLKSLMNFQNHRANVLLHEMICRYFKMGILKAGA